MRFATALVTAAFLTTAMADAALARSLQECRTITDSLARLTCYDAIPLAGAPAASAQGESKSDRKAGKQTVEFVSSELRIQGEDFERNIFNPRVELIPTFRNTSSKTVVAISHRLAVKDAFGDTILENSDKLDIRIPPGQTVRSSIYYLWEDNPFIRDEAYDRLLGPVSNGTAKVESAVSTVIYSDGSVDSF